MLTAFAPFLADSGGEEQDDEFLGLAKAPTVYTYHKISGCLSSLCLQKLFLSGRKTVSSISREPLT